jgi:hypothetical protein
MMPASSSWNQPLPRQSQLNHLQNLVNTFEPPSVVDAYSFLGTLMKAQARIIAGLAAIHRPRPPSALPTPASIVSANGGANNAGPHREQSHARPSPPPPAPIPSAAQSDQCPNASPEPEPQGFMAHGSRHYRRARRSRQAHQQQQQQQQPLCSTPHCNYRGKVHDHQQFPVSRYPTTRKPRQRREVNMDSDEKRDPKPALSLPDPPSSSSSSPPTSPSSSASPTYSPADITSTPRPPLPPLPPPPLPANAPRKIANTPPAGPPKPKRQRSTSVDSASHYLSSPSFLSLTLPRSLPLPPDLRGDAHTTTSQS